MPAEKALAAKQLITISKTWIYINERKMLRSGMTMIVLFGSDESK